MWSSAGDGAIDTAELQGMLRTGLDESSVQLGRRQLKYLTDTLLQAADLDSDGSISFGEFMAALRRYPDLVDNFSLRYRIIMCTIMALE